jgi:uncharacterized damage-inducible protein DinB
MTTTTKSGEVIAPIHTDELLSHWQGHRALTRRVIDSFPEKELFEFSVGGMRPFAELTQELLQMAVPALRGIATGIWEKSDEVFAPREWPKTKAGLLELWDKCTQEINSLWETVPAQRFQEVDVAFGLWEDKMHGTLAYIVDNEIHHRGQGYVYLRVLGIEPPPFWERQ